jgi:hypothetical protein
MSQANVEILRAAFDEWNAGDTFRESKVFLMEYFWDHAEALETLGLSE